MLILSILPIPVNCSFVNSLVVLIAEALAVVAVPGVAAHVVAALLPEAGLVLGEEADALDPLGRLPRVEARDDEADGAAVLGRDGPAVVRPREERVLGEEVFDGQVRRPAVVESLGDDELRFGRDTDQLRNRPRRDAAPQVIQARPARHAVE